MNVWYITISFPVPSEAFAASDVRVLQSKGIRVSVHSLKPRSRLSRRLARERELGGVAMSYGGARQVLKGFFLALLNPLEVSCFVAWIVKHTVRQPGHLVRSIALVPRVLELCREIERQNPEVVHLFWGHYPALIAYRLKQLRSHSVLSIFLGAYDLTMKYGCSPPVARMADVVWTHAAVNIKEIEQMGIPRQRIHVSHRGLDLSAAACVASSKQDKKVMTVGRLIESKGVSDALRAFAAIRARIPQAELVILGDGPERRRLKATAENLGLSDAVAFRGHVPHSVVFSMLAESSVLLFMSRKDSERLPNVVKEAMLCGCVPVVTNTPGIDELVDHAINGYVVEQGDLEAAARYVERLLSNPDHARTMASRGRERILCDFDAEKSMQAYVNCWHELVQQRRADASDLGSKHHQSKEGS